MTAGATVSVNRRVIESLIEQLIELLDNADQAAAIEGDKAKQEAES